MDPKLIEKYIAGDADVEETRQVVEWIQHSDENMREYIAQRKLYDITLWRSERIQESENSKRLYLRPFIKEIIKIAAIIIFVLGGVYLWENKVQISNTMTYQCLSTPPGQRAELTLEDGTHVWLNANSEITYPSSFAKNHRDITLQGEAYFKVTHNVHRPFTVNARGYKIRVLGTEFNVQAYNNKEYEVDLIQGSVHITTPDNSIANLAPGERIYNKDGRTVKDNIIHPEHFKWRDGLICFDDATIGDMIEKLKLYYGTNIVIKNKEILTNRYTGKFWTSDGVEHVFKTLQLDNKFTYTKDEENNLYIIR